MYPCVFQAKRHYLVAVEAPIRYEGYVLLVGWMHEDLIVSGVGIHKTQHFMPRCGVDHLVYSREWKAILWAGFVEIAEVDTCSPAPVGFDH